VSPGVECCAIIETAREAAVPGDPKDRVTLIVSDIEADPDRARISAEELFPLVYDELRRLARSFMARSTPVTPSSPPPWCTKPT